MGVTVKPAPKAEAPKEPSPVKEPEPVQPKKSFLSQKKKEPEPPKEEEKPPAEGDRFKLKKAETVKRQWDDGGLENVNLKHHEFEKPPQDEQPERNTEVLLSESIPDKNDDDDGKNKDKKKKKKVPKKPSQKQDDQDEDLV